MEGVEGAGKSTLIARLQPWLASRGHQVTVLREPGGTEAGERLRALVKDKALPLEPLSELFLFEAARHELVTRAIAPALAEGAVVLLDRFYDSTTAYQGYGRGIDLALVERLHRAACGAVCPHTTLLLDLDPERGLQRVQNDSERVDAHAHDRFEQTEPDFLRRVREGFLEIARREPERIVCFSASEPPAVIWENVENSLEKRGF